MVLLFQKYLKFKLAALTSDCQDIYDFSYKTTACKWPKMFLYGSLISVKSFGSYYKSKISNLFIHYWLLPQCSLRGMGNSEVILNPSLLNCFVWNKELKYSKVLFCKRVKKKLYIRIVKTRYISFVSNVALWFLFSLLLVYTVHVPRCANIIIWKTIMSNVHMLSFYYENVHDYN